ncbi:MAG: PQQ-dependent sugar dehydrogenase, partial [Candidatus Eisenbacteria bacterium]|nr:PQQ-dependent sugar dehydrogenase [Candidatus Eisenbacteria bacterium]
MKRPLAVLALLALFASAAPAQVVPAGFRDELVVGGFDVPVAMEFLSDGRLLVAEQLSARVRLVVNGAISTTNPVFTVPGVIAGGEQGLLGLAVDPQFPLRPYLYTHQTDGSGFVRLSRWKLAGDLAFTGDGHLTVDPATRYDLVTNAPNSASNHNGGTVQFGTGGYLFVSLGEDANTCAAQDLVTLRGKILRLDVSKLPDGPGSAWRAQIAPLDNPFAASPDSNARLVYANGLRNPFRFQVDSIGQRLVIADVGYAVYEELDLLDDTANPGAISTDGRGLAGANFGWPWKEGKSDYEGCPGSPPVLVSPINQYDRSLLVSASIISAGVYRSSTPDTTRWPVEYHGNIFYNDYYGGVLTRLVPSGGTWVIPPAVPGQPGATTWGTGFARVSDWRVGRDGSLWYTRQYTGAFRNTGSIRRVVWSGGAIVGVPPSPL